MPFTPTISPLNSPYNDRRPLDSSKISLKRVRGYSYDIILTFLRSHRINEQLKINGLIRGDATPEENNCLLHSIFQQLPEERRGGFSNFTNAIRTRIEKTNQEQLSINDEVEGIQILSAIQNYLIEKTGINYCLNLTVLFADNDGDIAYVDVSGIEQSLDRCGDSITLRIIIVNYNHYEPLFESCDVDYLASGLKDLELEQKSSSSNLSQLNIAEAALPSYVVNMPMKVDSDEELEESSDEEIDQSFPQAAFHRPSNYFRLLPESEGTGRNKKKNTKRGKIVAPLLQQSGSVQSNAKGRLSPLLTLFEREVNRIYSLTSQNRLGISIGLNKMRSLSKSRNKSLTSCLGERVVSKIPVNKVGFFWDGIWQKYSGGSWVTTSYDEVRHFYKQLKRSNPEIAKQFRRITEAHRGHMIPYREVRDTLKNNLATKELVQHFRREHERSDVYIVFLDGDILSFRYQRKDPGMFSVLDENYLMNQFEICSTGYTIKEPDHLFLELGVLADLFVREATAKHIKRGVYYPEPCTAVKVPIGCDSIPERFSNPRDSDYESPKEMTRLIDEVLRNRKLDPQKAMVFDARGAIVTALPKRMERQFFSQKTKKNGFILWELSEFQTMRGINQSHYNSRDWALNLLPALNICSQVKIREYVLSDRKVIQDVLTSLLSRLFNAFDPVELAQKKSKATHLPFQVCLIDTLNNYKSIRSETISTTLEKRTEKTPRKNARNLEEARRKSQAVNAFWLQVDSLSSVTSVLDMIKILLKQDFSQNLRDAAAGSGVRLVKLFKNRLCLNYKKLVINALSELLDESIDENKLPEIYIDIIHGAPITQVGSIRDTRRRLSEFELDLDNFYGISPLHMAALSGNLTVINWLQESFHSLYALDGLDSNEQFPFDYALTHCRYNGVNLDLLASVCCEEILEEVQEAVDNILESIFDKLLVLNHLIEIFGTDIIQEYDGALFIEAIKKEYEALALQLSGLGDYSNDISDAILDLAPDVDEDLIKWADEDDIQWVMEQLCESDEILFKMNLGYFSSPQSSDHELEYEDYDDEF